MKNFAFLSFAFDLENCFHNVEELYSFDGLENVRAAFNNYGAGKVIKYFEESEFKAMRVVIIDNCAENNVLALTNDAAVITIKSWINTDSFTNLLKKHLRAVSSVYNKGNEVIFVF